MQVLNDDPKVGKAHYKRAQGYMGLKDYDNALSDFKMAFDMYPNDKQIYKDFLHARICKLNYLAKEKEVFSKMFR